jgi:hypothetical protein
MKFLGKGAELKFLNQIQAFPFINTNALNKVTSPPLSPPLEGEGWVGGKRSYCVCISFLISLSTSFHIWPWRLRVNLQKGQVRTAPSNNSVKG